MPYSYYNFVSGVNGEMVMTTNLVSVTLNVGCQTKLHRVRVGDKIDFLIIASHTVGL